MSTTHEEIVQKQLDYYNAHDLKGFISTYSDNIQIFRLDDHSLILEGKEELTRRYRERFEVNKVHAKLVNRMVIGKQVIDQEEVTRQTDDTITRAVAIYEVEDERIQRVWFLYE